MSVPAAFLRVPPLTPEGWAKRPLDERILAGTVSFVLARLEENLVAEPDSAAERMASVLAYQVRTVAKRLELVLGQFHSVGELVHEWIELSDIARMWADHPDYEEDFGRTPWEFPGLTPTHAVLTLRRGGCSCPDAMSHFHRAEILPLEALDRAPWSVLRLSKRLHPTGRYRRLRTGELAEHYEVLRAGTAARTVPTLPGALADVV